MADEISSLSLSGRVVLLTMADLSLSGDTPVHTGRVIRATTDHLDAVDADTIGTLDEAEVNRALNRLEEEGLVEMAQPDDTSPVGKGRPAYSLSVSTDTVVDALSDDKDVTGLATQVAEAAE